MCFSDIRCTLSLFPGDFAFFWSTFAEVSLAALWVSAYGGDLMLASSGSGLVDRREPLREPRRLYWSIDLAWIASISRFCCALYSKRLYDSLLRMGLHAKNYSKPCSLASFVFLAWSHASSPPASQMCGSAPLSRRNLTESRMSSFIIWIKGVFP